MNWIEQIATLPSKGVYSQFNEDRIIEHIFKTIPPISKLFVDVGAGQYSGEMSNTKLLHESGWNGVGFDAETNHGYIKQAFITPHNIIQLMLDSSVNVNFDFLNIDIDSCDYWVLKNILSKFKPAVICCEFNGCLNPNQSTALRYEDGYIWDGTDKYGFSFLAGKKLLELHGYKLIYNQHNTNLFAVQNSVVDLPFFEEVTAKQMHYHPHNTKAIWQFV